MKTENCALRKKIGRLLMFGFSGTELNDSIYGLIGEQRIGGVILFSENIVDPQQLRQLCHDLQKLHKEQGGDKPLFISVDQEGGGISRIPWLKDRYPDPIFLANEGSSKKAFDFGYGLGRELASLGINLNLAPVLDVLSNQENTLLARRCLGKDAQKVAALGQEMIRGLHHGGVLAVGKHFPGHGDVTADSHYTLPVSHCTLKTLERREFIPFIRAIHSGLKVMMTAHVQYPQLDLKYPATLSKKIIRDIMRNQLGFEGLIMTDDLLMKAITNNYSLEEAALLAVKAGVDIVLVCHNPDQQRRVRQALLDNYHDPELKAHIDCASQRIGKFKEKWQKGMLG
jgi:beta-N-acetylhexosaminidase